jgi:nitrate/nitrite transport system substrate-binding protein
MVPEAVRVGAWAAGSDAPEKKEVKIGFIRSPTARRS